MSCENGEWFGFDVIWGAIFCNFPAEVTASGFFYSRCSGLIFKDLPTFWKNGEFSVFAFRDI